MTGKPTVLFVDNEATTRRIFDVQFTSFGIPHYIADSPENAVHILIENPVDIVVTDLIEPGEDGTDLIHCLRNSPDTETLPIIYFAADGDPDGVISAINAGATTVMMKPMTSPDSLVERIYTLTKDTLAAG
jgi:CheY-like chemotaxis protein